LEIHIDCDDGWVYAQDLQNSNFNSISIYPEAIDNFVKVLEKFHLKAVFFVVGKDLEENPTCTASLKKAVAAGHKIGNHTYQHNSSFNSLSTEDAELEITKNHNLLTKRLEIKIEHFRAPGYSQRNDVIPALFALEYKYECSSYSGLYLPLLNLLFKTLKLPKRFLKDNSESNHDLKKMKNAIATPFKLPAHSTFLAILPSILQNIILRNIRKDSEYLLFHAIDLVEKIPIKSPHPMSKMSFESRQQFVENALKKGLKVRQ